MSAVFTTYKQALLTGTAPDLESVTLKAVLVATAPDPDTDEFLSDILLADRLATSGALSGVSVTAGVLDADDVTIPGGSGTAVALVLYVDTGTASTSRLLAVMDDLEGLPLALDLAEDTVRWNASGIFAL